MKELSIEKKAKAYDEALERAKLILSGEGVPALPGMNMIEAIFPELKESEDERIRKEILDCFIAMKQQGCFPSKHKEQYDSWINWLEKQGEQKSIWHNEDEEPQRGSLILLVMQSGTPIVAKIIEPNHTFNHGERWAYIDDLLEKQGEKKPTDKVEPKFHEGEWVILTAGELSTTLQIVKVDTNKRLYWFNDSSYLPIVDEECLQLWTIQDAKNGDVLNSPSHHLIWIYKDNENYHACVNMNYVTENIATNGLISIPNDACPATKDERTILFSNVEKSGYKWDAEKKELKKIGLRPCQWNISDFRTWQYIVSDVLTKHDGIGQYLDNGFCKKIAKYMQEEWSKKLSLGKNTAEWSEEDEVGLGDALWAIEQSRTIAKDENDMGNLWYAERWLKSLKDRYTWKPSEEQMNALDSTLQYSKVSHNSSEYLNSLFNDLKKLREE